MRIQKKMSGRLYRLLTVMAVFLFVACTEGDKRTLDYIPVKMGDKWGYVNREGKWLITPQFEKAYAFRDGWAVVVREDGSYAFINTDGKVMNDVWYKGVTHFSEGKAWVIVENAAPVLIDTKGKILAEVQEVDVVYNYSDGLAPASVKDEQSGEVRYGYLDSKGKWAISPQFENVGVFANGRACVVRTNSETGRNEYGYIDVSGKLVIPYQFSFGSYFRKNGYAVVEIRSGNENKWGLIDRDGHYVITPQFGDLNDDGDELTCRFVGSDLYGRCDRKGKIQMNPQFKSLSSFNGEKLAPASLNDEKAGYVDKEGHFAINPQFDYASPFLGDMAIVRVDEKYGFIGADGKYLVNPQFDDVDGEVINIYLGKKIMDFVKSDYFDVTSIAEKIKEGLKEGGMMGYTLGMTVGELIKKAGMEENQVMTDSQMPTRLFYNESWMPKASLSLDMRGNFFESVSDGWWGYENVFDAKRYPVSMECTVAISDSEKKDKLPQLFEAVKKVFHVRENGEQDSVFAVQGKYRFNISYDNEGVHIIISKKDENRSV